MDQSRLTSPAFLPSLFSTCIFRLILQWGLPSCTHQKEGEKIMGLPIAISFHVAIMGSLEMERLSDDHRIPIYLLLESIPLYYVGSHVV